MKTAFPTEATISNKGDVSSDVFISSLVINGIDKTAKSLDIILEPYFLRYEIPCDVLKADRGIVKFSSIVDMLEDIAKDTGVEDFGLQVGIQQASLHFGILTEIFMASPNIKEAARNVQRHLHIYNQSAYWDLRSENGDVMLFRRFKALHPRPITQHLSLSVTIVYKALKRFCGENWQPSSIHFSHAPPVNTKLYKAFFKAPVYFNSDITGLIFDQKTLDIKIPTSNPALLKILTQHLESEHLPLREDPNIELALRNYMRSQIGTGFDSLRFFAKHIGVHPRKVQRILAAENLNFREILSDIKYEIAQHYLINSSSSLAEISFILGYENASAFSRAFSKKTKGISPSQFRLNQKRTT